MAAAAQLDTAGDIRAGESLDVGAVDGWLKQQLPGLSGAPAVTQYSGGASNWTYRLQYPAHDLILRRPPSGTKAKGAHDMGREHRIQAALRPVFPYVPEMVAHCTDESVLGCEFYVMRRIEGLIPRSRMPAGLDLTADEHRTLCLNVIHRLVDLHAVDPGAAGLGDLGRGAGYAQRQIAGWTKRYADAHTWNVPKFARVTAWLAENIPPESRICVIHNDYRLDNVILDPAEPTRVIGILDWELATLGDPLMDVGNSLAYWVQADDDFVRRATRRQPTHLPGMLTRRELVEEYCGRTGLRAGDFTWYEVYGLFRLAVIGQQLYYRYHHGQTRNPEFRTIWILVHYIQWRLHRIIRDHAKGKAW